VPEDVQIKRVCDQDIQGSAIELLGQNVAANYITTPIEPSGKLSIQLPYLTLLIKNVFLAW